MQKVKTKLLTLGFWLLASSLLTGCFEANLKLEVHPSGKVEQVLTLHEIAKNPQATKLIGDFADGLESDGWKIDRSPQQIVAHKALARGGQLGLNAFSNEQVKFSKTGNWLVEAYQLEVNIARLNPNVAGLVPGQQVFSLFARTSAPRLTLSLQTPIAAIHHNADQVEGKRYTWKVNYLGQNRYFIEYRLVRWDRIALAVLSLLAGLFLMGWIAKQLRAGAAI